MPKTIIEIPEKPFYMSDLRASHKDGIEKIFCNPDFFYAYTHTTEDGSQPDLVKAAENYCNLAESWYINKPEAEWLMGIFRENNDELVGVAVLDNVNKYHPNKYNDMRLSEVGYFLDVNYQGQGLAYHAERTLIEWAVNERNLTGDLWASVAPDNYPSIKTIKKLGMEQVDFLEAGKMRYKNKDGQPDSRCIFRGSIAHSLKMV